MKLPDGASSLTYTLEKDGTADGGDDAGVGVETSLLDSTTAPGIRNGQPR